MWDNIFFIDISTLTQTQWSATNMIFLNYMYFFFASLFLFTFENNPLKWQYLLAKLAYRMTTTIIPEFKPPGAYQAGNVEFNFHLAKSRVRTPHAPYMSRKMRRI
ncbi:hypothetical protein VP01_196g7 [Puccinia sorghi]|uniref:Uncharacterized protein n=1 Tax=Puccinia sorghi TaxID=27349 RepID=A0A0L6VBW4_9BASI|nr:hypothetical protein VP01_196g7 [Puccinia sorghi]